MRGRPTGTPSLWVAYYQIGFPHGPKKWQYGRLGLFFGMGRVRIRPQKCAHPNRKAIVPKTHTPRAGVLPQTPARQGTPEAHRRRRAAAG